jgi:hypothetical protein
MNLHPEELARFNAKWHPEGECHVWDGPLDKDGYGSFFLRRKRRRAHRAAWFNLHGDIPKGMVVNHSCRNRACVNPQHLQLMTVRENNLKDSSSPAYLNSRKLTCRQGHPFDGVERRSDGTVRQRVCSICQKEKQRRLRQKWAAEDTISV